MRHHPFAAPAFTASMTVHAEQVESVLSRAIQEVLVRGLNDPRVTGMTSVTGVDVSRDLANATVRVSILPPHAARLTLHGLQHAARHIRRAVGDRVRMRRVPELSFKLDRALKKEAQILAAIDGARRHDEARRGHGGSPSPHLDHA